MKGTTGDIRAACYTIEKAEKGSLAKGYRSVLAGNISGVLTKDAKIFLNCCISIGMRKKN